jgi:hypothetical protein
MSGKGGCPASGTGRSHEVRHLSFAIFYYRAHLRPAARVPPNARAGASRGRAARYHGRRCGRGLSA